MLVTRAVLGCRAMLATKAARLQGYIYNQGYYAPLQGYIYARNQGFARLQGHALLEKHAKPLTCNDTFLDGDHQSSSILDWKDANSTDGRCIQDTRLVQDSINMLMDVLPQAKTSEDLLSNLKVVPYFCHLDFTINAAMDDIVFPDA